MSVDPTSGSSSVTATVPVRTSAATGASSASSASAPGGASTTLGTDTISSSKPPTLAVGSTGPQVEALQKLVGATPDGIYGPKTAAAVASYQSKAGLSADGVAGPRTWNSLTGGGKTLASGSRGAAVAGVQRLVGATPDGAYGPKTQAVVASYQSAHGLRADGVVGPNTWNSLTSGAKSFANLGTASTPAKPQSAARPDGTGAAAARVPTGTGTGTAGSGTATAGSSAATAGPEAEANSKDGSGNALVDDGSQYLDKLAQYFTQPVNVGKQAGSIAAKFAQRDFQALSDAAKANGAFASKVRSVVDDFGNKPASEVESSIRGLLDDVKAGKGTFSAPPAVRGAASGLRDANAVPRALEDLGAKASSAVDGAVSSAQNALENAPGALRGLGRWASQKLGDAVDSAKSSIASAYANSSLKALPDDVRAQAGSAASTLESAAAQQSAQAASPLLKGLKAIGTTPNDLTPGKIPLIGNVPILNLAATAYGTVHDAKKVGTADSVVANVGSMYASQLGGRAVQSALVDGLGSAAETTIGETAAGLAGDAALAGGAEVAGDALIGAAVATGPAGWAVLAGVGAGIAIGVGVKDVVESKAGQDIINGAFSGNLDRVGKGFSEAGTDIVDAGKGAVHLAGDAIDEGKKALNSIGSFLGL